MSATQSAVVDKAFLLEVLNSLRRYSSLASREFQLSQSLQPAVVVAAAVVEEARLAARKSAFASRWLQVAGYQRDVLPCVEIARSAADFSLA